MQKKGDRTLVLLAVILSGTALAATPGLTENEQRNEISQDRQAQYLMTIAELKNLVSSGKPAPSQENLIKLKETLPQTSKQQLETFINAELLLAEGRFDKANRSYDKFLDEYPRSELYESALDRQFQIATAYLAGRKRQFLTFFKIKGYSEGAKIMEKIADRAGDAPIAQRAMTSIAESYEKRRKFTLAYESWSQISSRWPGGDIGREALLGMAKNMHAAYRGPKYDASSLYSAKSYYHDLQMRYPQYAEEIGTEQILARIEEQIAYKQYAIGKYYEKTDSKLASNLYYQHVAENWPDSTAAGIAEKAEKKESKQEKEK
jgi:outer membrane protein assembly factor BamD (BamD/ComL family)